MRQIDETEALDYDRISSSLQYRDFMAVDGPAQGRECQRNRMKIGWKN